MSKKLCDLKKLLKTDLMAYSLYVSQPNYLCEKCGRVANEKKRVCKPRAIDK